MSNGVAESEIHVSFGSVQLMAECIDLDATACNSKFTVSYFTDRPSYFVLIFVIFILNNSYCKAYSFGQREIAGIV